MPFNRKDHHHYLGEIRPRFVLRSPYKQQTILHRLSSFTQQDDSVDGKLIRNQYYLDIPQKHRHYWSPELRISLEEDEYNEYNGDTLIRVTVGPQQSVWLMFVFIYAFLSFATLFGGMYGISQWSLGIESFWIWCFPITFVLLISVYVVAKLGQRTARDHTLHLVSVLYHALGEDGCKRIES